MAKLNLIKKIVDDGTINSFNLVLNTLFGGKFPELYDENKVYNKGDFVIANYNGVTKVFKVNKDGVSGPFDINNFDEIMFLNTFEETNVLIQNFTNVQSSQEALSDDLALLVYELAGLLDNRLVMKVLYRENFRNLDCITLNTGLHVPGAIHAIPNNGLDFKLKNPIELVVQPKRFKIKHIIELLGTPTLGCSITFNALDNEPYWFNANEAMLSADFFDIPEFEKEENVPYALDVRVFGSCTTGSSLVISDFMVVFI